MTTDLEKASQKWADKFDQVQRWWKDGTGNVTLPADLERQVKWWEWIYNKLHTGRYARDTELVQEILRKAEIDGLKVSQRTAYNYINDCRRFYGAISVTNVDFEKVMQVSELKDDIKKAKARNDFRSVAALRKLLVSILGLDQPTQAGEQKTVINILNYNPVQLGAKEIPPEKLDKLIRDIMTEDRRKEEALFDSFTDVSDQPAR